jgi:lysophospholipase L1-like esterase
MQSKILIVLSAALTIGTFRVMAAPAASPAASTAPGPAVEVRGSDPNILYLGRWDLTDSGVALGYWNGHYVRTKFSGTSVGVRLRNPVQLAVSIDGEPLRFINAQAGVTLLNDKPLKPGDHPLQIGSGGQNYEVAFQGLVLDPGAMTKPVTARPVIEFIGDSITTGVGSNYAWCAAEMLGRDHTQIAFSGVALTNNYGCSSKIGMDVQYFRLKNYNHSKDDPQLPWRFSYTPEVVVINLGQNDQCGKAPPEAVTASYMQFVKNIRARFPDAPILMMRPFGGPYEKAIREAWEILRQTDPKVTFVDTTGWLGKDDYVDGIHPNATGHLKAARLLANAIAPMLATTQP